MSNHHENSRQLATAVFKIAFAEAHPINWPNDEGKSKDEAEIYADFTYLAGDTVDAAIGVRLERMPVVFGCRLYLPVNRGTKVAYKLADTLETALANKQFKSDDGTTTLKTRRVNCRYGGEKKGKVIFSVTITAVADTEEAP